MDHVVSLKKDPAALTFADLRCHFPTGRAFVKSGSGRDRVYGYRHGIMTDLGDIEESEWIALIQNLIQKSGEVEIQAQLRCWAKDRCAWLHTKQEIELYALKLHASRIFEDPQWVEYQLFNEVYHPKCKSREVAK